MNQIPKKKIKTGFRKTNMEREDAVLYRDESTGKEKWIPRDPFELLKPQKIEVKEDENKRM